MRNPPLTRESEDARSNARAIPGMFEAASHVSPAQLPDNRAPDASTACRRAPQAISPSPALAFIVVEDREACGNSVRFALLDHTS